MSTLDRLYSSPYYRPSWQVGSDRAYCVPGYMTTNYFTPSFTAHRSFSYGGVGEEQYMGFHSLYSPFSTGYGFNRSYQGVGSTLRLQDGQRRRFAQSPDQLFPSKAREVVQISRSPLKSAQQKAILSSLSLAGNSVIADGSSLVRWEFTLCDQVLGTGDPPALAALGLTTGFSLISGGLAVHSGMREAAAAGKVSDLAALKFARLKIASGVATAIAGAAFIPVRAVTLATLAHRAATAHTAMRIAGILGRVGGGLFGVALLFSGIGLAIKLNEMHQFSQGLENVLKERTMDDPRSDALRALEYLKLLVSVTPLEQAEISKELAKDPAYCALGSAQKKERAASMQRDLLQRKEALFVRVAGQASLDLLRLDKGEDRDVANTVATIQATHRHKKQLAQLAGILVGLGLVVAIASIAATGPAALIVVTVASLALSLSWLLMDLYEFIQECKNAQSGEYDALWLGLSNSLAVGAVIAVCILSHGVAPVVAACVVGGLWLTVNQVASRCLYKGSQGKQRSHSTAGLKPAMV